MSPLILVLDVSLRSFDRTLSFPTLRSQFSHTCVWEKDLTGLKGFETTASLFCQAKFVSLPNFLLRKKLPLSPMMDDYFNRSQEIRREIESSPRIMGVLSDHFEGKKKAAYLCVGQHHAIYRIGQLESGLWAAMRHNLYAGLGGITIAKVLSQYGAYADNAELPVEGKRATRFCIGVAKSGGKIFGKRGFVGIRGDVGLLVEDFTEGGTREFELGTENEKWLANPRELIQVDFDEDSRMFSGDRYMEDRNMILL